MPTADDVRRLSERVSDLSDAIKEESKRQRRQDIGRNIGIALALTVGALGIGVGISNRNDARHERQQDQRSIDLNCATGRRSWDSLHEVIEEAYSGGSSIASIDPTTLPPRTRQLLADLLPLLSAQDANDSENGAKDRVLARLGTRPKCSTDD